MNFVTRTLGIPYIPGLRNWSGETKWLAFGLSRPQFFRVEVVHNIIPKPTDDREWNWSPQTRFPILFVQFNILILSLQVKRMHNINQMIEDARKNLCHRIHVQKIVLMLVWFENVSDNWNRWLQNIIRFRWVRMNLTRQS